jgi:hypothetical protein
MNRLVTPGAIFVEGDSDRAILARWFPHLQFFAVNGKNNALSKRHGAGASWIVILPMRLSLRQVVYRKAVSLSCVGIASKITYWNQP